MTWRALSVSLYCSEHMEGDMDVSERKMSRMACEKCIQRWWGLADVARHLVQRTLSPRLLN
jgi:hypothetical protein